MIDSIWRVKVQGDHWEITGRSLWVAVHRVLQDGERLFDFCPGTERVRRQGCQPGRHGGVVLEIQPKSHRPSEPTGPRGRGRWRVLSASTGHTRSNTKKARGCSSGVDIPSYRSANRFLNTQRVHGAPRASQAVHLPLAVHRLTRAVLAEVRRGMQTRGQGLHGE